MKKAQATTIMIIAVLVVIAIALILIVLKPSTTGNTINQQQTQETSNSYCGDGICQPNENCDSCSTDCGICKKNLGMSCSYNSECLSNYCVHNYCRDSQTYCGDNYCDNGETCDSCFSDCRNLCYDVIENFAFNCIKQCPRAKILGISVEYVEVDCKQRCDNLISQKFDSYGLNPENLNTNLFTDTTLLKYNCLKSCDAVSRAGYFTFDYNCVQNCLK